MKEISVVVPVFNECESLDELYGEIGAALEKTGGQCETIFVDDGSTDGSYDILSAIRGKNPGSVHVIRFAANLGKADALQAGFDAAQGQIVITMDADLQDDPAEIPALVEALDNGLDMVSGWKKTRLDPLTKTLPSKVFNKAVQFFSGLKLHDFNCGLKAYRREVIESFMIYGELHRYIPVLAKFNGFRVGEIAVNHRPRKYGHTKYGIKRFLSGFLDLLTVILLTRYTSKPLHLFGSVGLGLCFLGGLVNLHVVIIFIRNSFQGISGRIPYLLGGIFLFLLGVQFISTGLLAELITHSRMEKTRTHRVDSETSS